MGTITGRPAVAALLLIAEGGVAAGRRRAATVTSGARRGPLERPRARGVVISIMAGNILLEGPQHVGSSLAMATMPHARFRWMCFRQFSRSPTNRLRPTIHHIRLPTHT